MKPYKSTLGAQRPFRMVAGQASLSDLYDGNLAMGLAAGAKTVYYADTNVGNDENSGINGWEDSFATLAVALAASAADIAADSYGTAARNVILARGNFDEDLVLLAANTDVIGVGSYGNAAKTGLLGNHVPIGAASTFGTRFFNFEFLGDATTGGVLWTLAATTSGMEFHGCTFDSTSSTEATTGILATASPNLGVFDCNFYNAFSTACISIAAGDASGLRVSGSKLESAAVGILVNSSATCANETGVIDNNTIYATTLVIDENANKFIVEKNKLYSAAVTIAAAIDINLPTALANYLANPTVNMIYPTEDAST